MSPTKREVRIDVVACTFMRPRLLARLIAAVAAQILEDIHLRLIVVDNDPQQSAQPVLHEAALRHPALDLCYVTEPRKNIALARNAGLDQCNATYIAFVDDDELPCRDWLLHLYSTARDYEAGLVFGPVLPDFDASTPTWLIEGEFFDRPRHPTGTPLPLNEARTGNVLIRADLISASGLRFDPVLGLSGGEDYAFFRGLYPLAGAAIWCDHASVREDVPIERATPCWLLRRSFRIGSVEASLARRSGALGRLARVALKSGYLCLKLALTIFMAPFCSRTRRLKLLRQGAIGMGLVYGLLFGAYNEYQ